MTEAKARRRTGCQILHQHICTPEKAVQNLGRFGVLHVQGDAAFAAIEPDKKARLTMNKTVVVTGEVSLTRPLHLDDIGTKVRHVARANRCRDRMFKRHNTDAFEWKHDFPVS